MIRVVAGKFKNFNLKQPPNEITRVTADRIKESIFDIIQFKIEGKIFIDLFAGSGSLGIEALSRGALKVLFNEKNHQAFKVINENLNKLKVQNFEVFNYQALDFLENKRGIKIDYIFLDAPYQNTKLINKTLLKIKEIQILNKYGLIILETNLKNKNNIKIPKGLIIQKEKKYGKRIIIFISQNK